MGNGSSAGQDLFLFLGLMAALFLLWVNLGGPDQSSDAKPFLEVEFRNADGSYSTGESAQSRRELEENLFDVQTTLKKLQQDLQEARVRGEGSPYEGMVTLGSGRAKERIAQNEYLELSARSGNDIDIPVTGWTLESVVTGQRATIGEATRLPFPGVVNAESTLFLAPGDRAYVITGRSPIGVSFKVNMCVGYFEQYQNFSPRLRLECPDPAREFDERATLPVTNVRLENDRREICRVFIDRNVDRCEINRIDLTNTELRLTPECQAFIEDTYTYSGCVENHRYESGFFRNEWRVFLGSPAELWREKREIIRLLDQNGRTVDIIDY